jgi:cbb3-type cytochrome oxidase subunit 3
MFKRLKLLPVLAFIFLASPRATFAQRAWTGRCVANGDVATIQGLECLFYNILQIITYAAGLAFFVMFLVGGFNYLFSGNDQKKVAAASSTLTMAIVGLVGIIISWLVILFINNFTGVNVIDFNIPGP